MFIKALLLIRITKVGVKHFRPNFLKPLLCSRCGFFSTKLQSKHFFFNLFLCGGLKLFTLKINTLQIKLQISEK